MMAIYLMMRHLDKGENINISEVLNTPGDDEDIVSAADQWIVTLEQTEKDAREMICQLKKMIDFLNFNPPVLHQSYTPDL
ncbi:hypothetical protein [Candidatus Contubernalis alkaliaceticus]|uniref:hypothetical protein n=1 Tax=Candidatus Contubernalis alkaliaceticus TaxID=338645 RepID=UPI001F4C47E2|nr:hypothetical protein [Candidatus Contubernalis alkalaceticus]UNC92322.1 hypothetical protein HUE98_09560 [Candidatus Contubernalis alkalaceticus]